MLPIPAAAIGLAHLGGVCQVQVAVTDAGHGWAEVKDSDSTVLGSAASGSARILSRESGTGTKWAVVRLGDQPSGAATAATETPEPVTDAAGSLGTVDKYALEDHAHELNVLGPLIWTTVDELRQLTVDVADPLLVVDDQLTVNPLDNIAASAENLAELTGKINSLLADLKAKGYMDPDP